jgi:hypothetical protein
MAVAVQGAPQFPGAMCATNEHKDQYLSFQVQFMRKKKGHGLNALEN